MHLTKNDLKYFCELTAANELEIAKDNIDFTKKYGPSLKDLFQRMELYLTVNANNYIANWNNNDK